GDLICRLAARGHEPLSELIVAYAVRGFGATRGTLHSALEMMKGGDLAYEDGQWHPAGHGPLRASFTFSAPRGRQPVGQYPCVAGARGEAGSIGRAAVRGSDVYGLTAVTAVHCAALMADEGFDRAGGLSPAAAFDPVEFLDYLGDHGVSYEPGEPVAEAAAV